MLEDSLPTLTVSPQASNAVKDEVITATLPEARPFLDPIWGRQVMKEFITTATICHHAPQSTIAIAASVEAATFQTNGREIVSGRCWFVWQLVVLSYFSVFHDARVRTCSVHICGYKFKPEACSCGRSSNVALPASMTRGPAPNHHESCKFQQEHSIACWTGQSFSRFILGSY